MKKPTFYLAHPFDSRLAIRHWEQKIEERLGINLINPFYDKDRDDIMDIDMGRKERYSVDPKDIVLPDCEAISEADGIVAIIDGSLSYGTIMEIVHAFFIYGILPCIKHPIQFMFEPMKPIFIMCSTGHHKHPWLQYHGTYISKTLYDLEKDIVTYLEKGNSHGR